MKHEATTAPETRAFSSQGYEAYESLWESQNTIHPARQGLSEEEYTSALADPETASTRITRCEEQVTVPQLIPLRHIKWLNQEFYAKAFPDAYDTGTIMCLNNSTDTVIGQEVQAAIRSLAERQGVLVFDYPNSEPEYLNRVQETLNSLNVRGGDLQQLGTQTYYAGKVILKRGYNPDESSKSLATTYVQLKEQGRVSTNTSGTSLHTAVSPEIANHMNEFYDAAFKVLNEHPCKQGLSPEEFKDMAVNETEVVKLLHTDKGVADSLCILGEDLSKFDWINPTYFKRTFPKEAEGQIAYFPAIATDPNKQGGRNSEAIIGLIAKLCEAGNNEMIVAFDCCDMNAGFLNVFLEVMINNTPEAAIHFDVLDIQRYFALRLSA